MGRPPGAGRRLMLDFAGEGAPDAISDASCKRNHAATSRASLRPPRSGGRLVSRPPQRSFRLERSHPPSGPEVYAGNLGIKRGRMPGCPAARRGTGRRPPVHSPRWMTSAGSRGCRSSIGRRRDRARRRSGARDPLPPSLQGLPPRSVPEVAPTPLQRHYINLSVVVLICGAIAITALELGVPLGSPLVKLCVVIAAPLLVVTTADAPSCGSGARPGRGCRSIAARASSASPGSRSA